MIRAVGESRVDHAPTNAGVEVALAHAVRARWRHRPIEEIFATGDGEAGPDPYEVRVGWTGITT